ncbi:MAG TPA: hypothetical protein VKS20_14385 [Candidatus Acidoferrales bacterium]|nr:hypothetical protein [Candidatus Acidoferrales bacterium]
MNTQRTNFHQLLNAILIAAAFFLGVGFTGRPVAAVQLTAKTARAFDQYVRAVEARSDEELAAHRNFLYIDALPQPQKNQAYGELQRGEILIQRNDQCASSHCAPIPGGLIHDWIGLVFVPGVSMAQALSVLQDYDRDAGYYQPQVIKSKLLEKSGGDFQVFLRLKQVEVITVILDTQYHIRYTRLDRAHVYSRSYSTRIAEVENAGTPQERDAAPGNDHGFLWRLDSYWHFYQADGGVYIQCRAISLTRDVPTGLGWLIGSFIEKIPAKSLRATLSETHAALLDQFHHEKEAAQ